MYRRDNLKTFPKSRNHPLSSGFFLPKLSDQLYFVMVDRQGSFALAVSLGTVLSPLSVCHHSVTRMAVGFELTQRNLVMKRQVQARASAYSKNAHIIEHTPIYDIEAFEKRLKQRKTQQFFKSLLSNSFILSTFVLTFSLLFIWE